MTADTRAAPHSTPINVPTPATSATTSKPSDNTGISHVHMKRFTVAEAYGLRSGCIFASLILFGNKAPPLQSCLVIIGALF